MSTIIKRAFTQLSGFVHALLDKTQNPINDARRLVHELNTQIQKVESAAAELLAQEIRLLNKKKKALAIAEEFGTHAQSAMDKNDSELATKCIERQMDYEAQAAELDAELAIVTPRAKAIRDRLEKLRKSHSDANRQLTSLESRYAAGKAGIKASKLLKEVSGYDVGGEMARAREAVTDVESLAEAFDEVNTTDQERLDEKIKSLKGNQREAEVQARLQSLTKTGQTSSVAK